jgi:hypothetical protein
MGYIAMVRLLPLFLILLTSCSSLQKWALRRSTPVLNKLSDNLTKEDSWEFFKNSAPGNLKLLELIYLTDEENYRLLPNVIKAHVGYGYGVQETLLFEDELKGVENSPYKKEAINHYTRALDYGVQYLAEKGIKRGDLLNLDEDNLRKKLKKETDEKDLVAIVYLGQAWGSLINLQKDNVALISQVPRVKILFDHACKVNPDIEHGICDIFMAQYEASRPRMMGGNPEKAKELYQAAMKKRPKHLLIPINMIQYVDIPMMDTEAYEKTAEHLRTEFAAWENKDRANLEDESTYKKDRELNLYNAIAKKRFEIIEQYKKKIF